MKMSIVRAFGRLERYEVYGGRCLGPWIGSGWHLSGNPASVGPSTSSAVAHTWGPSICSARGVIFSSLHQVRRSRSRPSPMWVPDLASPRRPGSGDEEGRTSLSSMALPCILAQGRRLPTRVGL